MEKIVEQTLLFDFYGELLTEHQKIIYEDVVFGDLSFTEAAEARSISRQGVHDLVRRCDKTLEGYEKKLHLLERFLGTKEKVTRIRALSRNYQEQEEAVVMAEIEAISDEILEEL